MMTQDKLEREVQAFAKRVAGTLKAGDDYSVVVRLRAGRESRVAVVRYSVGRPISEEEWQAIDGAVEKPQHAEILRFAWKSNCSFRISAMAKYLEKQGVRNPKSDIATVIAALSNVRTILRRKNLYFGFWCTSANFCTNKEEKIYEFGRI